MPHASMRRIAESSSMSGIGMSRGSSVRIAVCTIVNAVRGSVLIGRAFADALRDGFLLREFGAPPREFVGRHRVDVQIVVFPARVVAPALRRHARGARSGGRFEQRERARQRVALRCFVERLAGGIAERKVAEQEARHADVFDDVARAPHHDRWYAVRLEMARHEADGLMTDRTVRDEQRDVGLQLAARGEHRRRVAFLRRALAAVGRHADHVRWPASRSRRATPHSAAPSSATTCSDRRRWCGFDRKRCARCADPAAGRSVRDTRDRTSRRRCTRRRVLDRRASDRNARRS